MNESVLLAASDLYVSFDGAHGRIDVVRGVSLDVRRGEALALIGESGSGKSTLARTLLGMVPHRAGSLTMEGTPLRGPARERSLEQRRRIGMVFQDSAASFNPRLTVDRILREPLELLRRAHGRSSTLQPADLLDQVGLSRSLLGRRAHELSGGQRQRVGIARALAGEPDLLICDEPVSALDVSVQAQILNLLSDLQEETELAFLFITHDLTVVEYFADRVAVMCDGRIVESGPLDSVLDRPETTYTRGLLDAVPKFDVAEWQGNPLPPSAR